MRRLPSSLVLALALAACGDNPDRTYSGVANATHDCGKERSVAVNGSGGTFSFTGTCDSVAVNGGDNRLTVEAAKALTINGAQNVVAIGAVDRVTVRGYGNTVSWRKGVAGTAPHAATTTGDSNSIVQAK